LYTSQFGKLQKQKEMAISQMGRERQRILDEKNNAIRRGLGKKQTSTDLVNTVMEAGGKFITDRATEIARQLNANERLNKSIDETHVTVKPEGGTDVKTSELQDKLETMDTSDSAAELSSTAVASLGSLFHKLPDVEQDVGSSIADRLNFDNHIA